MPLVRPATTSVASLALAAAGLCFSAPSTEAQVRICQWNVTNFGASESAARLNAFRSSFYGVVPSGLLAGESMSPDIVVLQEIIQGGAPSYPPPGNIASKQSSGQASVTAFKNMLNTAAGSPGDWEAAPYVANQGDTGNALFYRTSKVQLILPIVTLGTHGVDVCGAGNCGDQTNQSPRDNQRWRVRLVGYTGAGAELYIYGGHFKAGDTGTDQTRREPEARRIRADAGTLPSNIGGFILGGDFNIQASSQKAYRYLVEYSATTMAGYDTPTDVRQTLAGQFWDPINRPGNWNNTCAFRNIHTQEPGTEMDDRHDQILISASLRTGQGMSYIPAVSGGNILAAFVSAPTTNCASVTSNNDWYDANHSYRCWGNDGNHFNMAINAGGTNTQVGAAIAADLITTTQGNGHLPVFLDLQVPAKLGAPTATIDFGTVNQSASASVVISVTNAGNVGLHSKSGNGWGIDPLNYSLAASGGFAAPGGSFIRTATAAPAQSNTHTITMDTSTLGPRMGTLTITSDDPDEPARVIQLVGNVGSPSVTCCRGTTCIINVPGDSCVNIPGVNAITIASSCTGNTFAGCCYADFDKNGSVTIDDIFGFLNAWFSGSPFAQSNGDGAGTPQIGDIFIFLNNWFGGCS